MAELAGKVVLVTGASRGIGRGIAVGLGEAGVTVYITGRTVVEGGAPGDMPGTIYSVAEEVSRAGGRGIPVPCDHRNDEEVRDVFRRIGAEQNRLDVLVNNIWGGYEHYYDGTEFWNEKGFWTEPLERWDRMFVAGVRAHYVSSVFAAPIMIRQGHGLIVTISAEAARRNDLGVLYGASKAACDRLAAGMAHELREHGVASISLYPGLVRTEAVLRAGDYFDLSNSESPQLVGRAVAALAADGEIMKRSGRVLQVAQIAREYGFTDIDGSQPEVPPLPSMPEA